MSAGSSQDTLQAPAPKRPRLREPCEKKPLVSPKMRPRQLPPPPLAPLSPPAPLDQSLTAAGLEQPEPPIGLGGGQPDLDEPSPSDDVDYGGDDEEPVSVQEKEPERTREPESVSSTGFIRQQGTGEITLLGSWATARACAWLTSHRRRVLQENGLQETAQLGDLLLSAQKNIHDEFKTLLRWNNHYEGGKGQGRWALIGLPWQPANDMMKNLPTVDDKGSGPNRAKIDGFIKSTLTRQFGQHAFAYTVLQCGIGRRLGDP